MMKKPWIVLGVAAVAAMLIGRSFRTAPRSAPDEHAGRSSSSQSGSVAAPQSHGWLARSDEGDAATTGGQPLKSRAEHGDDAPRGKSVDSAHASSDAPASLPGALRGQTGSGSDSTAGPAMRVASAAPNGPLALDHGQASAGAAAADGPDSSRSDVAAQEQVEVGQGGGTGLTPDVIYDSGEKTRFDTAAQTEVKDVGNISGDTGSISLWVRPQWDTGSQDDADLLALGDNKLHLFKNVNFLRFEFASQNELDAGTGVNIADWTQGDWHQVAMSWGEPAANGQRMAMLFVDGKVAGQLAYNGALDLTSGMPLYIGSNYAGQRPVAPGVLSTVQVSAQGASPADIAARFQAAQPPKD